jgi:O-succinylbenzoate synthase
MRIERVDLYHISMPLVAPFETSGWVETERAVPLVAVHAQGLTGWGECTASSSGGPWYSPETDETAWLMLSRYLIPMVLGQDLAGPRETFDRLARVRGHNMAKAALEMAVWDLFAKAEGVSLSALLGGVRARVEVGVSVGIQQSIPATVERIGGYLGDGYRRVKVKTRPGWDVALVRAIRDAYPELRLQVDANSAYSLEELPVLQALDDYELLLIEQPLGYDDIYDHIQVQRALRTPVCLDESIHSPDHARAALELGACRIINIKAGRVGGLRESTRIHDLARARGNAVWCGGMLETNVGRAHNVALASLPGFTLPGDISATARYYAADIAGPDFVLNADGTLDVPRGPGIGVEIMAERLQAVTRRREAWTA